MNIGTKNFKKEKVFSFQLTSGKEIHTGRVPGKKERGFEVELLSETNYRNYNLKAAYGILSGPGSHHQCIFPDS
jgi:hypothetical protein